MNLGDHVGDDAHHVAQNRALLRDAIDVSPVFLTQVHGSRVVHLGQQAMTAMPGGPHPVAALSDVQNPQGRQGEHGSHAVQADACITQHPGVACTIMVADCLPVLLTNRHGTVVGAAHAGWRGLAGGPGPEKSGVLEAVYRRLRPLAAQDILVWLGPCIGPGKFEVGSDVRDAFVAQDASAQTMFRPCGPGKWLADLAGLARQRLRALGIEAIYGNDGGPEWCTASNPSRFFSHRRDALVLGGGGRMAACIWLG